MVTLYDRSEHKADDEPPHEWQAIFDAPDLTQLLNPKGGPKAAEYTKKINSVLKAGFLSFVNGGNFPDAAAILQYGPTFAKAGGTLAESSDTAAKAIDVLTSPSNPVAMFAIAALTLGGQLWRNHEKELAEVPTTIRERRARKKAMRAAGAPPPQPQFTIKLGRWQIPVRFRFRPASVLANGVRYQTQDPMLLTAQVFGDPDVAKLLDKMGFKVVPKHETP